MRHLKRNLPLTLGLLTLVAVLSIATFKAAERYFFERLAERAETSIALQRENLNGWLGRFRALPSVFARHPDLSRALRYPDDFELRDRVSLLLERWSFATGAQESFLVNLDGQVIASSDWSDRDTLLNRNVSGTPQHMEALQGRLGRQFDYGDADGQGERAYQFSFPVRIGTGVAGVIVVRADIDRLEEEMRLSPDEVFVTDRDGVVVLSGQPALRLTSLADDARFPVTPVANLSDGPLSAWELVTGPADRSDSAPREFMHVAVPIATEGWRLHLLAQTGTARTQAVLAMIGAVLVMLVLGLVVALILMRRRTLLQRLTAREREGRLLEQKVSARTAALKTANQRLEQEVRDRTAAEAELRRTQAEMVQVGKMAVLGQMSTALSHEFNQPLTAIRSYAENADAFIERDLPVKARENLSRIQRLTARMAQLSRSLANFARKPGEGLEDTSVAKVVEEALGLLEARLDRAGVTVELGGDFANAVARAGDIRLQHVLMNLIGNALDATEGQDGARIWLDVEQTAQSVILRVSDNGPGVPEQLRAQVFDPFYTTKDVGRGIGLGLSITFNIVTDFGGTIRVDDGPEGGAMFVVTLDRARPLADVAAQ
ncbi:sensor histidine kinase [Pontivivens insulae]|uniref:sensor histidine kinase n=1 Tax=Pontivivens insulae TaxID=1639689 RepID=UPI0013C357D0|nr:ATP-binding protein [Pontivivens insulae]